MSILAFFAVTKVTRERPFPAEAFDKLPLSRHYEGQSVKGFQPHSSIAQPPEESMSELMRRLWSDEQGQDIAEYAVMLAVILVLVVGTIRLIGTNANTVFSQAASAVQ